MRRFVLFFSVLFVINVTLAQKVVKTPGLMLGNDSTLIIREYSRFNNISVNERWEKYSTPGRIIYYCQNSSDKNKSNVAHIYDFDEKGKNYKYTTVTTQEKIKYAVDYFNTLVLNKKRVYEFMGVTSDNEAVWISNDEVAEDANCNCGNVKVTVISNLKHDDNIAENSGVKPGKSGELLAIVYTSKQ